MLHNLESLNESSVLATDGEIGRVCNFLFDDQSWTIRYLVVDVRKWLDRHDVLLAISAVELPDWDKKAFPVHLTKDQVRRSPDVDTKKPVSRQQEIAMKEYYQWPAYWHDSEFPPLPSGPTGTEFPLHTKEDPHLRSAWALADYEVCAADGAVGRLKDYIMDDASWHIGYLDVKAGDWLHGRSMLVPTRSVQSISWADYRVNLRPTREGI
ncbi:MAG TPA: PRC-barrel domain-containing protein [Bryobacteraceae bacterium]|jgi:uncharacterized protein YrrD